MAIPLSWQVSAVQDLDALGPIPGCRAAAVELGKLRRFTRRFFWSLHYACWSHQNSPISWIQVCGVLVSHHHNETVMVPAPGDYVSWTERIAGFAADPELLSLQNRMLWMTGKMTPLARQTLKRRMANGMGPQEKSRRLTGSMRYREDIEWLMQDAAF